MIVGRDIFHDIALRWVSLSLTDNLLNISSGNGMVPSGPKP